MTPSPATSARIALIPLDERPVTTQIPAHVAAVAGATLELPPRECLPRFREGADPEALAAWLEDRAPELDRAVVSIDGYLYGGLITARTSSDSTAALLTRLQRLATVRLGDVAVAGGRAVDAFTVVTRATDSYSADEEPDYWPQHGRELHSRGAAQHRWLAAGPQARPEPLGDDGVPASVRRDFWERRLRNHVVNLEAIRLRSAGLLASLVITADDTAGFSAGSAEQEWLEYWRHALELDDALPMYPGADEVGAALVARALLGDDAPVRIALEWAEPQGRDRVASYENVPIEQSVARQCQAAGAVLCDRADAEALLVVNPPSAARMDWCGAVDLDADPEGAVAAERIAAVVKDRGDLPVAVADARQSNGGDPRVLGALVAADLCNIAAYGGWNTAGNALGSTVATLVATVVGRRRGTYDPSAARRALLTRILDDAVYQPELRGKHAEPPALGITHEDVGGRDLDEFRAAVTADLAARLAKLAPELNLTSCELPWGRTFEVDLRVE